eukprot:4230432-Lingulodinium_polyedra.AAC.1
MATVTGSDSPTAPGGRGVPNALGIAGAPELHPLCTALFPALLAEVECVAPSIGRIPELRAPP